MNKRLIALCAVAGSLIFIAAIGDTFDSVMVNPNTGVIQNNYSMTYSNQLNMTISPTSNNHLLRRVDLTSPTIAFTATNAVPPTVNAQVVNGGNRLIITSAITLQTGATTSMAKLSLYTVSGSTTNIFGPCQITNVITSPTIMQLIGYIQPSATYWYTNQCSGVASATLNAASQNNITY